MGTCKLSSVYSSGVTTTDTLVLCACADIVIFAGAFALCISVYLFTSMWGQHLAVDLNTCS
jgi:hypothetical protein